MVAHADAAAARSLLVELLVEELPPKALKKLGEAFAHALADDLKAQGLAGADAVFTPFASPRRLAVHLSAVSAVAPDKPVSQKLMPVSVGLTPEGQPTPALLKKLASLGADVSDPALAVAALLPVHNQVGPSSAAVSLWRHLYIATDPVIKLAVAHRKEDQAEKAGDVSGWMLDIIMDGGIKGA
jgi:hypothetical protein